VDHYYENLNRRHQLGMFYVSASPKLTAAALVPDISINGQHVTSVADYEALLDKQGSPVVYEVHSFDAHPGECASCKCCPCGICPVLSCAPLIHVKGVLSR
jgi:hypothetical protein